MPAQNVEFSQVAFSNLFKVRGGIDQAQDNLTVNED